MPTASPLVSVVIPTYKHSDYVLETIRSVVDQTYSRIEIIVVNDGSPDDTRERLRPLADAGTIRYFHQENAGQGVARNRGIEAASGEFVALLDDDDLLPPDKIAWQVEALQAAPVCDVVYGRVETIDDAGNPSEENGVDGGTPLWKEDGPDGDVWAHFAERNRVVSPGQCLIRRSALHALPGAPLDPELWGCDDYDLWLRLARRAPFCFVPRLSLRYRLHATNASRSLARLQRNTYRMYEKHRAAETEPVRQELLNVSLRAARDSFAYHALRPTLTGDTTLAPVPKELVQEAWRAASPRLIARLIRERFRKTS